MKKFYLSDLIQLTLFHYLINIAGILHALTITTVIGTDTWFQWSIAEAIRLNYSDVGHSIVIIYGLKKKKFFNFKVEFLH